MDMKSQRASSVAFIVIGVVFIAIGSSGQPAFLGLGAVFIVLGVVFLARRRGAGGSP